MEVEKKWVMPLVLGADKLHATLQVTLGPQYEVASVTVAESSGNDEFDKSVVMAVMAVGQFPELKALPPDEAKVFERFKFQFRPGGT